MRSCVVGVPCCCLFHCATVPVSQGPVHGDRLMNMQLYTQHVDACIHFCFNSRQPNSYPSVPSLYCTVLSSIDSIILMLVYKLIERQWFSKGSIKLNIYYLPLNYWIDLFFCSALFAVQHHHLPPFPLVSDLSLHADTTCTFTQRPPPKTKQNKRPTHTCSTMLVSLGFVTSTPPCFSLLMGLSLPLSLLLTLVLPRR